MRKFIFPLVNNEAISLANLLTEEPKLFVRDTYYFLGHMDGILKYNMYQIFGS